MRWAVLFFMLWVSVSCRCPKEIVGSNTTSKVDVSKLVTITERVVHVPVLIEVPAQRVVDVVSPKDTSRLETDFAKSTAYVRGDGLLFHSLENKPQSKPVSVPVIVADTSRVTNTKTTTTTIEKIPVRTLTWWDKLWITSGRVAWAAALLAVAWWGLRRRWVV